MYFNDRVWNLIKEYMFGKCKYVMAIDPGIINMGIVEAWVYNNYKEFTVIDCRLENITIYNCESSCKLLYHENCIADYMLHFFEKYRSKLERAAVIVIENQPPTSSALVVEEMIYYKYREKCVKIYSATLHSFYRMGNLDYDDRKKKVTRLSDRYLMSFKLYRISDRKHDMADAFAMFKYYFVGLYEKYLYEERVARIIVATESFRLDLDKYKYIA